MPHEGVEEEDDIRIIDPTKLDEQARLVKEAEDLARRKEKVEKKLGGTITGAPSRTTGKPRDIGLETQFLKDDIEKVEENVSDLQDSVFKIEDLISDPFNFFLGFFKKPAFITKLFAASALITGFTKIIIDRVKAMFAPGGVLDKRKFVLDQVKTIPELKALIDAKQGVVFFTPQIGLRQGAVKGIAENLRDGENLYRQEHIGDIMMRGI